MIRCNVLEIENWSFVAAAASRKITQGANNPRAIRGLFFVGSFYAVGSVAIAHY